MSHFKEDLFKCHRDVPSCLLGLCVPGGAICLQAAAINRIREQGCCIPYCIACTGHCVGQAVNRERIREVFGHKLNFWGDCCLWIYCGPCAGCQEYREVKKYYEKH